MKAMLLPTPLASLGTNGGPNQRDSSGRPGLQMAAMMWPTPCATDHKGSGKTGTRDRLDYATERGATKSHGMSNLNDQIGGQLNPTWVEWLMGWPLEWTDLKPLETDKFRLWCESHGIPYGAAGGTNAELSDSRPL